MKYVAIAAVVAATSFAALPAFAAKMMACTGENMAKSMTAGAAMPDTRGKYAMMKEMGAANTAMSKGNMRAACGNYMRAQKMSTMM